MTMGTLGEALEREHRDIDGGLAAFAAGLAEGETRPEPLLTASDALRRHIYLEEEMLFPSLRAAGFVAPVFVMIREHGDIWRGLDRIAAQLAASESHTAMLATCAELASALEAHNAKEEQILYPRADGVLTAKGSADLDAFIERGRMPDGWVCEGARA